MGGKAEEDVLRCREKGERELQRKRRDRVYTNRRWPRNIEKSIRERVRHQKSESSSSLSGPS